MKEDKQPNYVLKFNESVFVPKDEKKSKILSYIKKSIWIIIAILVIGSIIFGDNLFMELSGTTRILLIILILGILFYSDDKRAPSEMEIRFYDDYIILYREKMYYSPKVIRKRYDKFYYNDIHECQYRTQTKRINIYGIHEGKWYNYNKDGSIPTMPTYHKTTDSIDYFYTMFAGDIDFVKEIEEHSPIKVKVEES